MLYSTILIPECAVPEYSQRDSFEHSSSESGVTSHTHAGAEEWRAPPPALQPPPRPFSLLRAFVPSFIFVWVSLGLVALLVFETDWVFFSALKRKPELISLRRHYYVPLKEYLKRKVIELFWFAAIARQRSLDVKRSYKTLRWLCESN